jgi:hypothetical protein
MYFPMIFPVISMTYRIGKMTAPRGFEGDQGTYEMMIQRPIHLFFLIPITTISGWYIINYRFLMGFNGISWDFMGVHV